MPISKLFISAEDEERLHDLYEEADEEERREIDRGFSTYND